MADKKATIITAVTIVVLLLLLIIATSIGEKNKKQDPTNRNIETIIADAEKESNSVKENEKKDFTQITVDNYLEILSKNDNQFVLVARPTCHYCQIAEPIIQNIMYEYNIDLYYLNTDDFSEEDQSNFINSNEYFENGFGTPMLLCLKDNQIIDIIDGLMDRYGYTEFFKNYGLIK